MFDDDDDDNDDDDDDEDDDDDDDDFIILYDEGNCLELAADGILNHVHCNTTFACGCPNGFYFSNEIYKCMLCMLFSNFHCYKRQYTTILIILTLIMITCKILPFAIVKLMQFFVKQIDTSDN